jgi:hypothetical protein
VVIQELLDCAINCRRSGQDAVILISEEDLKLRRIFGDWETRILVVRPTTLDTRKAPGSKQELRENPPLFWAAVRGAVRLQDPSHLLLDET